MPDQLQKRESPIRASRSYNLTLFEGLGRRRLTRPFQLPLVQDTNRDVCAPGTVAKFVTALEPVFSRLSLLILISVVNDDGSSHVVFRR